MLVEGINVSSLLAPDKATVNWFEATSSDEDEEIISVGTPLESFDTLPPTLEATDATGRTSGVEPGVSAGTSLPSFMMSGGATIIRGRGSVPLEPFEVLLFTLKSTDAIGWSSEGVVDCS